MADSESFKFKLRFLNNTNSSGTINVVMAVTLKYLSNFSKAFELSLINYEINLVLTWSASYVISEVNRVITSIIQDKKPRIPVVTFSTDDNAKLLLQLKSRF